MIRTVVTRVRKCGRRKEHGVYLVAGEGGPGGVLDLFTLLHPPVPYSVPVHRGPRAVNAMAVFEHQPMDEWWVGASRRTEEKKAGDQWQLDTFGMTTTRRLKTGECVGANSEVEALAILTSRVRYDRRMVNLFKDLTENKLQEVSDRLNVEYNNLHLHLVQYADTGEVGALMGIQATIWRTAYKLPPSQRQTFVPTLARFLVLLGLKKDASALLRLFSEE